VFFRPSLSVRRCPHRSNGIRRVSSDEHAVHIELRESVSKNAGCMMPGAVVVCKRAYGVGVHVWLDGLVEDDAEPTVGPHAQLPRTAAATLDSAEIGRASCRERVQSWDRE